MKLTKQLFGSKGRTNNLDLNFTVIQSESLCLLYKQSFRTYDKIKERVQTAATVNGVSVNISAELSTSMNTTGSDGSANHTTVMK